MSDEANLPALPGEIDPDQEVVRFVLLACRDCPEQSEWMRDDRDEHAHAWDSQHEDATGHGQFYVYTLTRNRARIVRL